MSVTMKHLTDSVNVSRPWSRHWHGIGVSHTGIANGTADPCYGAREPKDPPERPTSLTANSLQLTVDGTAVRTLRLTRALTQHELARLAGVARITVARLEAGKPASTYSVRSIAQALGVDCQQITKVVSV